MAAPTSPTEAPQLRTRPVRLGVVSFLNTLPLIDGLERCADIELRHSVPSCLLDQLLQGEVDLALCSSIDFQHSPTPLTMVPAGLLGCDDATLTVRLYSRVPVEAITAVCCDTDSHTSVVLMQILLREVYGREPELIDYNAREHVARNRPVQWPETMLLIGDKVVTDSPPAVRYPHQIDLGKAWRRHTGLPFVFAIWMALQSTPPALLRTAAATLQRQRLFNHRRLESLIHHRATPRNWPADLARRYLGGYLAFELTPERLRGMELFFDKAHALGYIAQRRPAHFFDFDS